MPIKILHLTNYWHERSGGITTFYRQLKAANLLSSRPFQTSSHPFQPELKDMQTQ
jgi:hypothetical protein